MGSYVGCLLDANETCSIVVHWQVVAAGGCSAPAKAVVVSFEWVEGALLTSDRMQTYGLLLALALAACASDDGGEGPLSTGSGGDNQPAASSGGDQQPAAGGNGASGNGGTGAIAENNGGVSSSGGDDSPPPDGGTPPPDGPTEPECDLTGRWIVQHSTFSEALMAEQIATNWFYFEIVQEGDAFAVVDGLNCGLEVRGTTTVYLSEATLEALAQNNNSSRGRTGTFVLNQDGTQCELALDRTYNIRGANREILDSRWKMGDPPIPLDDFPLPEDAASGMEDWDADGKEGITLLSGLGSRCVAQLDWNEYSGTVPTGEDQFGGMGVIDVRFDSRETISKDTDPLLGLVTATPLGVGYAYMARVGDALQLGTGARPELETCHNVQALALERFGPPPMP